MKRMKARIPMFVVLQTLAAVLVLCCTSPAQTNIAPSGTGYTWHSMTSATGTNGKTAAPGINDGNLTVGVYCNPNNVTPDEWEGAGVIFSSTQTISTVVLYNGTTDSNGNGYLEANITLESSTNGTSWSKVSGWSLSPAYGYNGSASGQIYTFSGPAISAKGIRIVGQVYVAGYSWNWIVNEIRIFGAASATPTPTPTAIPTPTATPKPTATPTAIPTPTATANPTVTPTATQIPTATPKPTATPTATAKPTVTPTPAPDGSVWMGYNWTITTGGMAGVANGSPSNIFVDSNGYLHLNITNNGGTYTAAQTFTNNNLGFGTYQWQIQGNIWSMDPTTVLGLFPYGPENGIGQDGQNEIDIEFSQWDNQCGCNADFTVYPAVYDQGNSSYNDDYSVSDGTTLTTARMEWSSTSIVFTVMSGLQPIGTTANVLQTATYSSNTTNIPQAAMPVGMNLWCYNGTPASNQSVIIQSFQFVPQ